MVDQAALLKAWNLLFVVSVENALAGWRDVASFAKNHCLFFAAVRIPEKVVLPDTIEVSKLGLPDYATVISMGSPIMP